MPSSLRSEPIALEGQRIFVTGGTGFVGRSLLDYFAESARHGVSFEVIVLSRDPEAFLGRYPAYADAPWLRFVAGTLDALPETGSFTDLIHAAADTHGVDDRIAWFDQLVNGTRKTLEFAARAGVTRTLFVGSGAIYGRHVPPGAPTESDDANAPALADTTTVYAQGKRAAEHLCALFNERYGIGCVTARCFAILSPHMPFDGPYAAGNFIRDALSDRCATINIAGNPETVRSYIDGRDLAHWLCVLLTRGKVGEAYNVGSDEAISIEQLARLVCKALSVDKPVLVDAAGHKHPRSVYVPAIQKARELGLRIETGLQDAIRRAAVACL